ncbi:hypothetical protein [Hyalangium minutum]|uniref:Lipoprotein n=1 Tax=Hyalangium minutum TaxID=394096 RepID=A0A085WFK0_9BACT|nr:hypothetical protein [Hyalangium minutum]KFE66463.1 hypothetical protein DB31_0936 [Hyalangium minutum]
MNRSRFLAAALALVGLLGAAEVRSASSDQQSRLKSFQDKAQKERQAQKLDRKALFAKYPTPEIALVTAGGGGSPDEPPKSKGKGGGAAGGSAPGGSPGGAAGFVAVGTEATLSATGRFLPGSLSTVECQGVEVISEKITESNAEVRVKVTTAAPAGPCDLRIISPVSLASARRVAFRVIGNYNWELSLANGWKARMKTAAKPDTDLISGTSDWFDKGGKSLGSREVKVERTFDGYQVTVQRTAEEQAASDQAMNESGKAFKSQDNQQAAAAIQAKMQAECMKLPPAQMGGCIQKYTAEMTALSQRVQTQSQAGEKKAIASAVGCQALQLAVNEGKVTGRGTNCGAPGEVNVTGTVTATK